MIALELVLALAVILAVAYLLGGLARRLRQPAVMGHLLAGIVLGPSVLGALGGDLTNTLIPLDTRHDLSLLAQFALILFMFSLGSELDRGELRRRPRAVPLVATSTFVVPLALGAAAAVGLRHWYKPADAPTSAFVLFVAVAVAITALPVLASIVREHRLTESVPAAIAMTSAAVVDGIAWLVLAAALLEANVGESRSWGATVGLLAAYAVVMVLVVRPVLKEWLRRPATPPALRIVAVAAVAVASGWVTDELGLHAVIGAFFAGLIMPRGADGEADRALIGPIRAAGVLLLPLFLTLSGLSTDVGALHARDVAIFGLVCAVAVFGKLGVGWAAARAAGLTARDSAMVGVLLNTRGVTELVVLSVGLKAGVMGERLYTVFVLMALLTSAATGPLLSALRGAGEQTGGRSWLARRAALADGVGRAS
jgi:Kef-type K+ transport system membrane component KefB